MQKKRPRRRSQMAVTAMLSTLGVFLGYTVWLYLDYRTHPGLYAMNSAPWYVSLLPSAMVFAPLLLLEVALYFFFRHQDRIDAAQDPMPDED